MTAKLDEYILARVKNVIVVKVLISGELWSAEWKGRKHNICFSDVTLPAVLVEASKLYLRATLNNAGPQIISKQSTLLKKLENYWSKEWRDFSCLKMVDWMRLWNAEGETSKSSFRAQLRLFYTFCASQGLAGSDEVMASVLYEWPAKPGRAVYDDIIMWHEERGAMTAAEQELLRSQLFCSDNESLKDNCIRLLIWILFETLKRPTQIMHIKPDGLWNVRHGSSDEYFLWVPKAKHQIGEQPEAWPISSKLAIEIKKFSAKPEVQNAQVLEGCLLVMLGKRMIRVRQYDLGAFVTRWVKKRGIVSPRTKRPFKLALYRIRHTGATNLAMQGVSSDEIQYILEHESAAACAAYIDAVGSELCPLIERADRALGFVFSGLNECFFKGGLEDNVGPNVVLIPSVTVPAVVGSCGSDCGCKSHPFFSCYDGCPHFLAWIDADHSKALKYVESELERWEAATGRYERTKAIKDFDRIYAAILEVIQRISSMKR